MYLEPGRINQIATKDLEYNKAGIVLRIKKQVENTLEREAEVHSAFIEHPELLKSKKKIRKQVLDDLKWCWEYLENVNDGIIGHEDVSKVNRIINPVNRVSDYYSSGGKSLYRCGIVRIKHGAPGPGKVLPLMDKALRKINNKSMNSIEKAIYAHLMIAYIHPFEDGNGRTARLIQNHILHKNGFLPVSVPTIERNKYLTHIYNACMGIKEDNEERIKPFFEYMADKVESSLERVLKEFRD